ncbi:PREDICTED: retinol dehydrogenase 16-like [Branchiostoma belcheri]|uniref:Retinol dehydrogenase 16-like n=1 Tax=Branchiostoma belcheri TaxID=7741 RepID=A0A6P4YDN1_BRABE|nr:PREDICTED: retinol dehydrogenase 16-like [Branchiostoma belcheri]
MEVLTLLGLLAVLWTVYSVWTWWREKEMLPRLVEKSVLITGCDTGFGNLLARRLDQLGLRVFAGCLTEAGVAELRQACSERLQPIQMDVSSSDSVRQAFLVVKDSVESKGLWGLVNNAGIFGPIGSVEWPSIADYQAVLDVNLLGMIDVTKTFLPLLKKSPGRVVNVSSVGGRLSAPCTTPYAVSKYGVEGFSDALRRGIRCFGISVHIIEPEKFSTSIVQEDNIRKSLHRTWDSLSSETKEEYGQDYMDELLKGFNDGRYKDPAIVAMAMEHALCAACPRSRYEVDWGARWVAIPLTYLPTDLEDFVMRLLLPWMTPVPAACR